MKVLWDKAPEEGRRSQESFLIFKCRPFQAQEQSLSISRRASEDARRPAWMNKELLAKLRHKKEAYRR